MKKKRAKTGRGYLVAPNILRVDYARTHGFWVRFNRTVDGEKQVTGKLFSDLSHGGRIEALLAAQAWGKATAKRLPPPKKQGGRRGEVLPPGYSYVKRKAIFHYRNGFRYESEGYVAFLRIEDRKHLMTKWSILKWGDRVARKRCEAWLGRKKQELAARLRLAQKKKKRKR